VKLPLAFRHIIARKTNVITPRFPSYIRWK
jgi:hypothetical protein